MSAEPIAKPLSAKRGDAIAITITCREGRRDVPSGRLIARVERDPRVDIVPGAWSLITSIGTIHWFRSDDVAFWHRDPNEIIVSKVERLEHGHRNVEGWRAIAPDTLLERLVTAGVVTESELDELAERIEAGS